MMRHSLEGALITGSTADAMFRAAGLYQNGTAATEQRHRMRLLDEPRRIAGQFVTLDACQREWIIGISTDARTNASTLSRTRPMSGPKTNTIGCAGFGSAMKRSTSAALMAVMTPREIMCRPRRTRRVAIADIFGDFLGGTVFGITQTAFAGKSLLLTWNVVGHACEGLSFDNDTSGREFGQRICAVDAVVIDVGTGGVDVDDHLQLSCGEFHVQAVRGRKTAAAAG